MTRWRGSCPPGGVWFMPLTACPRSTVLPTMARVTVPSSSRPHPAARTGAAGGAPAAGSQQSRPQIHDVTIAVDAGHPGPVVAGDFAGLSFERQSLDAGHAGVTGRQRHKPDAARRAGTTPPRHR